MMQDAADTRCMPAVVTVFIDVPLPCHSAALQNSAACYGQLFNYANKRLAED